MTHQSFADIFPVTGKDGRDVAGLGVYVRCLDKYAAIMVPIRDLMEQIDI